MYIELEKAIEAVKGAFEFEVESPDNYRDIAVETLKLLPTADVVKRVSRSRRPSDDLVKVVRCKDCKYREREQPGMVYCPNTVGGWVDENWFCAGGEKE